MVFFYNLPSPKIRNYSITSPGPYIPKEIFAISILSAPPFCGLLNVENCKGRDTGDWESTLERNFHFCLWPHAALLSLNNHHKTKLFNSLIPSSSLNLPGRSERIRTFSALPGLEKSGPNFSLLNLATASPAAPPPHVAGPYVIALNLPSRRAPPLPPFPLHSIPRCCEVGGSG